MTEQIFTTKKGYSFSRDKILSIKEVRFKVKDEIPPKGTTGYVGNCLGELKDNINAGKIAQLDAFDFVSDKPFISDGYYCSFFLPQTDVIPPKEKKYRPFETETELFSVLQHYLGSSITYRNKNDPKTHFVGLFEGYVMEDKLLKSVCFAGRRFLPVYLFGSYEWEDNYGNWLPFGVEITEGSE